MTWRRTAIEISPRRGFRPNTAYRVTVLPGVADLRGNTISVPTEWVFSTGGSLPTGEMSGAVFDYSAGKSAPNAVVEVYAPADTVLRWRARADSSGRFTVRDLTAGTYVVRAFIDANNDRQLGEREAYDTSTVTIEERGTADLYAFVRDTMPPRIEQLELVDSTALRIRFDRAIVRDWDPTGAVKLLTADSTEIPFAGVLMPSTVYDSLMNSERAAAKQAARDSLPADSLADDSTAMSTRVREDSVATARMSSATRDSLASDSLAADTVTVVPPPTFERVPPVQQWTIRLAAPLAPALYKVRVEGAQGLNGARGQTTRELRVRPPEPTRPEAGSGTATPAIPVTPGTIPPELTGTPPAPTRLPEPSAPRRPR